MFIQIQTFNKSNGWFWGLTILVGIALLIAVVFMGITAVIKFVYPLIYQIALVSLAAFVLIVLPMSLIGRFRQSMARISLWISRLMGVSVWMYSFLFLVNALNWFAIIFMFLFPLVAPMAVVGLLLKGSVKEGIILMMFALISWGIKFYGNLLSVGVSQSSTKTFYSKNSSTDVFDIEGKVKE